MHQRRSRKQFHAPTPYGDPPPPEPDALKPRRLAIPVEDGAAMCFWGRVTRSLAQPDPQEAPPYNPNAMIRRWGRTEDLGDLTLLNGRVRRRNPSVVPGPYPIVTQFRGRRSKPADDFLVIANSRTTRRRVPVELEVSNARPLRTRVVRSEDLPEYAAGKVRRTRLVTTDPPAVIGTQRPIGRRPMNRPLDIPEQFPGRVVRSVLKMDPQDGQIQPRRYATICRFEVPPDPVIFKRNLFLTGLTADPEVCPSRPSVVDESCNAASFTEDDCGRPSVVEESNAPTTPVNVDDCC